MQKRKLASNLILFLFFIFVTIAALFSDIFQTPIKSVSQVIEQAQLFTTQNLELIKRISLKNKSGEYIFERDTSTQPNLWHMVAPKEISANSLFIEKLFNSLTSIKVKKTYPDEKLNTSNFSIDKPTSTLNLIDQNGKTITILFGLMNTIDNSTYLKIIGRNDIYHVEAPSVSLENANLLNLIESQIISMNIDTITSIKILHGNKNEDFPLLEISKKDGRWLDHFGNLLSKENINLFFRDLTNLKSSFIIEKPTDLQKRQISNLTKSSDYTISIEDDKNVIFKFDVGGFVKEIADIDLKNEEYFLITLPNESTTYILKKEYHEIFNRKSESFKPLMIKQDEVKGEIKPDKT